MATALDTRLHAKTVSPTLTVDNLEKSVAFFEGLGFGIEERWEENGTLLGVMLRAGDVQIGLSQDDWKKGRDREKGVGMRIYVSTTQDIDQLATDRTKTDDTGSFVIHVPASGVTLTPTAKGWAIPAATPLPDGAASIDVTLPPHA